MLGKPLALGSDGSHEQQQRRERMTEPNFRNYFAAAHEYAGLTEREKMFIGLAVTMTKTCEP